MWDECHCVVVWTFFCIALVWNWNENWPIPVLWASLVAQTVKCLSTMLETWVQSLRWEDPLEKEMATHSSILAWKIPWTEEPGGLQSLGWQKSWTWLSNSTTTNCVSRFPSLMRWAFCNHLRAWIEQKSGGRENSFFLLDWVGGTLVFSCLWADSDSSAFNVSYQWHIWFFRSSGLWIGRGTTTPAYLGLQFADGRLWEFLVSVIEFWLKISLYMSMYILLVLFLWRILWNILCIEQLKQSQI